MFVSLHQQLHNFKRESMKLLREVEHIVMWSIPFCHNTLGPLKLGYHRGRRSGVHTVNQLCKVCQWCFVIYRCQCLCHSEGRNVISSEECISKSVYNIGSGAVLLFKSPLKPPLLLCHEVSRFYWQRNTKYITSCTLALQGKKTNCWVEVAYSHE
jgi:hypothetical protein